MKLFAKPLGEHCRFAQTGIILIALFSIIRFVMLPVFNIPYAAGTHFTSVTILLLLLAPFYGVKTFNTGGSYRDVLGVSFVLATTAAALIILAIAVDDFGGLDTYYTDPAHGGNLNPWIHMLGHAIAAAVSTIVLWGLGSLAHAITARMKKKALA